MSRNDDPKPVRSRQMRFSGGYLLLAVAILLGVQYLLPKGPQPRTIPYSEMLDLVESGQVAAVEIRVEDIRAELKSEDEQGRAETVVASRIPNHDDGALLAALREQDVRIAGRIPEDSIWTGLLIGWLLPIALIVSLYVFMMRRMSRHAGGPLSFGKSRAKIHDLGAGERKTFEDVAGVDEAKAELTEVVDYLRNPTKYTTIGARIPKGVLLVGPPGTGKTLLARAVAGEAGVPFFSLSGSEFVEMFVGVGASRVRDLFAQAKERAPCIVFIDELDAIGKSRGGVGAMATHDEREQTLNQLLSEMDGFDGTTGVIIMAATNRPEVLDKALVRAGRFDRQVVVDRPDLAGREAILRVHTRRVKLAEEVELQTVARRTPGMSGADLANVVNEAALAAARRGSHIVANVDFEEAVDRMQLGLKKRGRAMSEDEKRRVAFHESGHALVALSVEHADPVHRVTIIPRTIGALGATLQLPTEDRYLVTREALLDQLAVMMGGRAAEVLACHGISTGAQNDLERATETARQMVCRFGMSEALGTVTYGRPMGLRFLESPVSFGEERNFSEETARLIDAEVRRLVEDAYQRALSILRSRRGVLDAVAHELLERETLEREDLLRLVEPPRVAAAARR